MVERFFRVKNAYREMFVWAKFSVGIGYKVMEAAPTLAQPPKNGNLFVRIGGSYQEAVPLKVLVWPYMKFCRKGSKLSILFITPIPRSMLLFAGELSR